MEFFLFILVRVCYFWVFRKRRKILRCLVGIPEENSSSDLKYHKQIEEIIVLYGERRGENET